MQLLPELRLLSPSAAWSYKACRALGVPEISVMSAGRGQNNSHRISKAEESGEKEEELESSKQAGTHSVITQGGFHRKPKTLRAILPQIH